MLTRREILIVTGGLAATAGGPRRAGAAPAAIEILAGRPKARIAWRRPHVFSIENDNQKFVLYVEVDSLPEGDFPVLAWDGREISAGSTGGDQTRKMATFNLTRDQAVRLARALGVKLQERRRLDDGLVATWRAASQPFQVGQPMPIAMKVDQRGSQTVGFVLGGRQRGPRDNRFSFTVRPVGGQPLAPIVAHDFGGISTTRKLAPGASLEVSADLRSWAEIMKPGDYDVDCAYEAELHTPDDKAGQWPERATDLWVWNTTGKIRITVR